MNGDGFDDIVIGAPGHSSPGNFQQGRVYVIYGKLANSSLIFFNKISYYLILNYDFYFICITILKLHLMLLLCLGTINGLAHDDTSLNVDADVILDGPDVSKHYSSIEYTS